MPHLLVSLTSHGFGHAAQTGPIINALRRRVADLRLTLRTDLHRTFLASRFAGDFDVVPGPGDFGLVMQSAMVIAHAESAARYARLHAHWERRVAAEAAALARIRPDLVISNISYLVLAGARAADIPAVALGSFNWALIYAHYFRDRPEAAGVLADMHAGYAAALRTLVLEPCMPMGPVPGFVRVGTVAQRGSGRGTRWRADAGLAAPTRLVALSLGGVAHALDLSGWPKEPDLHWLVPRAICPSRPDMTPQEEVPLPFTELLAACDAFVTKAGYGSFTEAACNGVPTLYIPRGDWPEERHLVAWLTHRGRVRALSADALGTAAMRPALENLWYQPPPRPVEPTGIDAATAAIIDLL